MRAVSWNFLMAFDSIECKCSLVVVDDVRGPRITSWTNPYTASLNVKSIDSEDSSLTMLTSERTIVQHRPNENSMINMETRISKNRNRNCLNMSHWNFDFVKVLLPLFLAISHDSLFRVRKIFLRNLICLRQPLYYNCQFYWWGLVVLFPGAHCASWFSLRMLNLAGSSVPDVTVNNDLCTIGTEKTSCRAILFSVIRTRVIILD